MQTLNKHLPSGHVSRFIARECFLVVDETVRAGPLLRLHAISAYVEFLAVVRMGKRGMGKFATVRRLDIAVRTGEAIVEDV